MFKEKNKKIPFCVGVNYPSLKKGAICEFQIWAVDLAAFQLGTLS